MTDLVLMLEGKLVAAPAIHMYARAAEKKLVLLNIRGVKAWGTHTEYRKSLSAKREQQ